MRIIAGSLGGRIFDSPPGNRTHPMSERVRGSLFNTLGDIIGLTLLDPFAGSGALSFEAISRGAASATALDVDKAATDVINKNARTLGLSDKVKATRAGVAGWLETAPAASFDLVLADPPYDDLQLATIHKLVGCVKPGGILVLSWPGKQEIPVLTPLDVIKTSSFGDSQLAFYRAS